MLVMYLLTPPTAQAAPTSPLCKDGSYRSQHPLICDTGGGPNPFIVGGGGGQRDGGLLGAVRRVLGGLTGGIL
ncbi:hypothetical protein I5G67_gp032 [Mycobacterium phage Aminay]|uniref:Uncharacterized protein n=1 Tax=Mycobacterium phage Aminay TaxID=2250291 RepID=A0A345KV18_9CAUD|nr:hypothetical protein I5G67_gp032 [Mycobacterium phage Aminay]AXH46870.1 hypothetical protein SEA_AMINAY_32 [Mycobacterium phage Aminay]